HSGLIKGALTAVSKRQHAALGYRGSVVPQDLSKLLAQGVDLDQEVERATKTLESIGLAGYEARGYIALVAHGYGSAETIAETARIPRTSAYKVLQSLCQKGFAISTRGRPTIFKPEAPSKVKGRVIDHLEDTFAKLDLLHEVLRSKGEPQLVRCERGRFRCLDCGARPVRVRLHGQRVAVAASGELPRDHHESKGVMPERGQFCALLRRRCDRGRPGGRLPRG